MEKADVVMNSFERSRPIREAAAKWAEEEEERLGRELTDDELSTKYEELCTAAELKRDEKGRIAG
jgi:hypothetical protein